MISQYPDTIVITLVSGSTQNENGHFVKGSTTELSLECRIEANRYAKKYIGDDGNEKDYKWDCFLPKMDTEIPDGSDYVVNGKIKGKTKWHKNNQLNSRIWL